jgi:hypothetical protein
VKISTFIEREIDGENAPEPIGIRAAQSKTYCQIHNEIRAAQRSREGQYGSLSEMEWIRFIQSFPLQTFVRAASHSVSMMKRYGAVSVTAVSMFGNKALLFLLVGQQYLSLWEASSNARQRETAVLKCANTSV